MNSSVLWKTDIYASTFIVNSGSCKDDLQKTADSIFYFCKENSITLKVMWIPIGGLSSVDKLNKIIDHDDWRTTKFFFETLNNHFGPQLYTSSKTTNIPKRGDSIQKLYVPLTAGVNAFNFHWSNEMNYLFPPVFLIPKIIKQLRYFSCSLLAAGNLLASNFRDQKYVQTAY